jgi:hypothetical protein
MDMRWKRVPEAEVTNTTKQSLVARIPDSTVVSFIKATGFNLTKQRNFMKNWTEVYETDYSTWVARHIELLKKGYFAEIDIEHLIEELEGRSRSDKRELESRLIVLIAHLLKWQFQLQDLKERWQGFEGQSWQSTIIEQRTQLG